MGQGFGEVVLAVVVVARILIPLGIPRFPLPAILAALVIDAADQTLLAALDAEPSNYQQFDKALDVYYLAVAYISTLRNWTDGPAFRVGQFLWYYRLVGVAAFELNGARFLLLVFPNTFEFFFIFYEAYRLRRDPSRIPRKTLFAIAASIWLFIKLPQEWWIHVAQLDFTEVANENPVGVWGAVFVLVAAVLFLYRRRLNLPPVDWPTTFAVDASPTTVFSTQAGAPLGPRSLINHPLFEKTILIGLLTTIFLQWAPEFGVGVIPVILGVGAFVALNSYVGHWLCRHGSTWTTTTADLVVTSAINVFAITVLTLLPDRPILEGPGLLLTVFLLGLLSFVITLYDRYRVLRLASVDHRISRTLAT